MQGYFIFVYRVLEPINRIQRQRLVEMPRTIGWIYLNRHLKLIQEKFGKANLSLTTLRDQVKAVQKQRTAQTRRKKRAEKHISNAPPGSCRACIDQAMIESEESSGAPEYTSIAEAAFEWFSANGAQFFHTPRGEPFMFFEDKLLPVLSNRDRGAAPKKPELAGSGVNEMVVKGLFLSILFEDRYYQVFSEPELEKEDNAAFANSLQALFT